MKYLILIISNFLCSRNSDVKGSYVGRGPGVTRVVVQYHVEQPPVSIAVTNLTTVQELLTQVRTKARSEGLTTSSNWEIFHPVKVNGKTEDRCASYIYICS